METFVRSSSAKYLVGTLRFIWLFLAAFVTVPSVAQTVDDVSRLTLTEAKKLAFEQNWDLLAAKADIDGATAQRIIAKEFPNPSLSFSVQKINVDEHPSNTASGNGFWDRNYDTIVAVNQLFEIGGKRKNRKESAVAGYESAKARLWDARRVLDAAVTKSYIGAVLAARNSEILRDSAKSLRQEVGIAEERLKAGDISVADKTQIEIAAERFELDAQTAESNARAARIKVDILLGRRNPIGEWVPGDTLDSLVALTSTTSSVHGTPRPDLLAAEATERKANADLKLQKAMRVPDPTFLAQYEHEPPDQPNTVGFGVSIPLPLWNRNKGNIRAAEAAQEQARIEIERTKSRIASEISSSEVAYADAMARWNRYDTTIRPQSEKVLQTVEFAYKKGGATLLDLLTAERNDNDIRLTTVQAFADAASAAADLVAAKNLPTSSETNESLKEKGK